MTVGRSGAVGGDHPGHAVGIPRASGGPARPGAAAARTATTPAPRSAASAASRAALPPGPAHRSSQRSSRPSSGAAASHHGDQLRALVLHAGAALGDGRHLRPGRRPASTTPYGEKRVGSPGSSSRVDRPGRATRVHPRRLVVGGEQVVELVGADRGAQLVDHPARVAVGDRGERVGATVGPERPGRSRPSSSCSETRAAPRWRSRAAPELTLDGTRSTVVLMAAWAGTRMDNSWWVPSRSASSTLASTLLHRPVDAGSEDRVVGARAADACPTASSVAKAASRPLRP